MTLNRDLFSIVPAGMCEGHFLKDGAQLKGKLYRVEHQGLTVVIRMCVGCYTRMKTQLPKATLTKVEDLSPDALRELREHLTRERTGG